MQLFTRLGDGRTLTLSNVNSFVSSTIPVPLFNMVRWVKLIDMKKFKIRQTDRPFGSHLQGHCLNWVFADLPSTVPPTFR